MSSIKNKKESDKKIDPIDPKKSNKLFRLKNHDKDKDKKKRRKSGKVGPETELIFNLPISSKSPPVDDGGKNSSSSSSESGGSSQLNQSKSEFRKKWQLHDQDKYGVIVLRSNSRASSSSDTSTSANSNEDLPKILLLPSSVRKLIWLKLSYKNQLALRLTCKHFKNDVDKRIGVILRLSDSQLESRLSLLKRVGVRKLKVRNFNSVVTKIPISYPHLLQDLSIGWSISSKNLRMLIDLSPGVKNLHVIYTRHVPIFLEVLFCSLTGERWLKYLKSIAFEFPNADGNQDNEYIRGALMGLLIENLWESPISKVFINITYSNNSAQNVDVPKTSSNSRLHTAPSLILDCHLILGLFVSKHFKSIKEFDLKLKKSHLGATTLPGKSTKSSSKSSRKRASDTVPLIFSKIFLQQVKSEAADMIEARNRAKQAYDEDKTLYQIQLDKVESLRSLTTLDTSLFKMSRKINSQNLKKVRLVIDGRYFKLWKSFLARIESLETLHINLGSVSNWSTYIQSIESNMNHRKTLQSISFSDIGNMKNYNDKKKKSKYDSINLKPFKKFEKLTKLSLTFLPKQRSRPTTRVNHKNNKSDINQKLIVGQRANIHHFASLPNSLDTFEVNWGNISSFRIFYLLAFNKNLKCLKIGFWSSSNTNFLFGLQIIRLMIKLHLTKLQRIIIVDYKKRFGSKSVQKLLLKLPNNYYYKDLDQDTSILIINIGESGQNNPEIIQRKVSNKSLIAR